MDAPWRIELLGGLRAVLGDRVVARFRTQSAGGLLGYLAYHSRRAHPREVLAELLWPEHAPKSARDSLNTALSSLRRQLEPPGVPAGAVIVADRFSAALNPVAVQVDAAEFQAAIAAARRGDAAAGRIPRLLSATELYRGELLPGFYEDWVESERARLAGEQLWALARLAADLAQEREFPRATEFAHRAVSADPLREESYQLLMGIYVSAGQPEAALEQYGLLERRLRESLDAVPSRASRSLAESLRARLPSGGTPRTRVGIGRPARRRAGDGRRTPGLHTPTPLSARTAPAADAEPPAPATGDRATPLPVQSEPQVSSGGLPLQFTRFYGREPELERLAELLEPLPQGSRRAEAQGGAHNEDHIAPVPLRPCPLAASVGTRLLTLTGPGGCGKTRLAIEAGSRLRDRFPGGVRFVPLADITDARLIGPTVRDALRLPRAPNADAWEQVAAALEGPPALLILDNLEQFRAGPPRPADASEAGAGFDRDSASLGPCLRALQAMVPGLTLLLTSRRRLDIAGERVVSVPPLPTPAAVESSELRVESPAKGHASPGTGLSTLNPQLSTLLNCESVALFVDRAQAARSDFQLTARNSAAVAALCRRLEGNPLAIELVAARAQTVTVSQMLVGASGSSDLLVSRRRDLPARHRSLHAAIEWSYRLLEPDLQRFFRRLAVFRGGWTQEAAEAVSEEVEHGAEFLRRLRDHCLVLGEERDSRLRYRLLETVREFAAGELEEEESGWLARRHARFFLAFAEAALPDLRSGQGNRWWDRLEAEHDNFRAALGWSLEDGDVETGLRLGGAVARFWFERGSLLEGKQWLERLLAMPGAESRTPGRGDVLMGLGETAYLLGDYPAARAHFTEALEIRRDRGDERGCAGALNNLANVVSQQGDLDEARKLYEEALAVSRRLGLRGAESIGLHNLGRTLLWLGEFQEALEHFELALRINRELDNRPWQAYDLAGVARTRLYLCDLGGAESAFEEALALYREAGNRQGVPIAVEGLARVACARGDRDRARALYAESLSGLPELGTPHTAPSILEGLAELEELEGDYARATRLRGAAAAIRESIGAARQPCERPGRERAIAAARATLGEADFAAAWAEGHALTWQEAVSYALRSIRAAE